MKKALAIALCGIIAVSSLTGCGSKEAEIESITASTYVAPGGRTLNKIIYSLSTSDGVNLSSEDFNIKFTIAPVDYLGETESKEQEAEISDVTIENNEVNIEFADVSFSTIEKTEIDCTDDKFDCTDADYEVKTKTADEFVKNEFTAQDGTVLTYYLYMPENEENVPLMVWEHGGGEVLDSSYEGANLHASKGAVAWVENGFDTAVLSVQYPKNYSFGISEIPEELEQMNKFSTAKYELIQQLIEEGKIDASRVYISGASSGGGAAIRFIMQYPDLFAGALVMSAKDTVISLSTKYDLAYKFGNNDDLKITDEEYQSSYNEMKEYLKDYNITNIPIWFVQAEDDQICTSYTSKMMFDILKEMGAENNKLTLYTDEEMENAGQIGSYHGSWAVALEDSKMLSWVYDQVKQSYFSRPFQVLCKH